VVKQYTENQYDDDLTVGTDDYDDSYYTGSVDLFEFSNDEESPISRLKSLILSIDWEITDEVLMQFNEELVDLKDIWAGEKINLVYVQALEKISKYIYQKKADSHPSAIKLLLTLYHNLEKIVSSYDLTEEQKKEILLEDVKRFESLKHHISKQPLTAAVEEADHEKSEEKTENKDRERELLNLKAIVLGIDWEITDQDLIEMRQEVVRLEEKYADSKPRLILLQGIGTLGAYIKLKKSNAHADAFKILHLFYDCLEKIVLSEMNIEEEKAILFPAVERFNSFKVLLGPSITSEAADKEETEDDEVDDSSDSIAFAPAFSDLPEEEAVGFQAEEEAKALGLESSGNVDNHVDSFFTGIGLGNSEEPVSADFTSSANIEKIEMALQGVDVEEDDEEDEDQISLSKSDTLSPALSDVIEENEEDELSPAFLDEESSQDEEREIQADSLGISEQLADSAVGFLSDDDNSEVDFSKLDKDAVLQGVDVETEADDDSDEEALPMMEGELAPALADNDEISIFNAGIFEDGSDSELDIEEIDGTLGGFFDEEIESHLSSAPKAKDKDLDLAVEVAESEITETKIASADDSFPLFNADSTDIEEPVVGGDIEEDDFTSLTTDSADFPEEKLLAFESEEYEENRDPLQSDTKNENIDGAIDFAAEVELEDSLDSFFDDGAIEQAEGHSIEEDVVPENAESGILEEDVEQESSVKLEEQLDLFFDDSVEQAAEHPIEEDVVPENAESGILEEDVEQESSVKLEEQLDSFFDDSVEQAAEHPIEEDVVSENAESGILEEDVEQESSVKLEEQLDLFFDDSVEQAAEHPIEEDVVSENAGSGILEEDVEQESSVKLEEQLDSFFDVGEGIDDSEDDTLFSVVPEESIETALSAEDDIIVASVSNDSEEDEVVFELAEDIEQLIEEEPDIDKSEQIASEEILSEEKEIYFKEQSSEDDEVFRDSIFPAIEADRTDFTYESLQICVDSLGIELEDKVISGLFEQIDLLEQDLADKPQEKTCLKLLSTIARHIDQNRYDSSSEAYILLQSVCAALTQLHEDDPQKNQEMLFTETSKVLEWQEMVLAEQTARNESELTIGDSVLSDQEAIIDDVDALLNDFEEEQVFDADDINGSPFDQSGIVEPVRPEEEQGELSAGVDRIILSNDLKKEISTLRQTLQDEIAELRKELKGNHP